MIKSPQQAIFDAVFMVCLELGYPTFDYLPPESQTLPFVYVGEQFDQDRATKSMVYGRVQQRIHIYHDYTRRADLTRMMDAIKRETRKIRKVSGFNIQANMPNSQTLIDQSTNKALYKGIIEIPFSFN